MPKDKNKAYRGLCVICSKAREEFPMCFQGDLACSDRCLKVMRGEVFPTDKEWQEMSFGMENSLRKFWNDKRDPGIPLIRGDRE